MGYVDDLRKEYQQLKQATPVKTTSSKETDIRNEYRLLTQPATTNVTTTPQVTNTPKTHAGVTHQPGTVLQAINKQEQLKNINEKTKTGQKLTDDEVKALALSKGINEKDIDYAIGLNNASKGVQKIYTTNSLAKGAKVTPEIAASLEKTTEKASTATKYKQDYGAKEAKEEASKLDWSDTNSTQYQDYKEKLKEAEAKEDYRNISKYTSLINNYKKNYLEKFGDSEQIDVVKSRKSFEAWQDTLAKDVRNFQNATNEAQKQVFASELLRDKAEYDKAYKTYADALTYDELMNNNILKDTASSFGKNVLGGTANIINGIYSLGSTLQGADASKIDSSGLYDFVHSNEQFNGLNPLMVSGATSYFTPAIEQLAKLRVLFPENYRLKKFTDEIMNKTFKGSAEDIKNELDAIQKDIYQNFKDVYTQDELDAVAEQARHNENYGDLAAIPNAFGTVGNMVPSILIGTATGGLGELAGGGTMATAGTVANRLQQVGSMGSLGAGAYSQSMDEALRDGATYNQAQLYGALSGATEVGTEMLGGESVNRFLGQQGKSALSKVFGKAIDNLNIESKVGRIVANTISDVAGESTEEMISEALNPLWKYLTYDENALPKDLGQYFSDIIKAGIDAIPSTLLMQGAGVAGNVVKTQQIENGIIKSINESDLSQIVKNQLTNEVRKASTDVKLGLEEAGTMQDKAWEKYFNLSAQSEQMKQRIPEGYSLPQSTIDILAYTENNRPGLTIAFDKNIQGNGTFVDNGDGTRTITLNPNSQRAVEFTLTHELGHDLKGTQEYSQLQDMLLDYAKGKPNYQKSLNALEKTYKESGANFNLEDEATNDLLGNAIGEQEFYNKLAENPTLFNRVTNSIKNILGNKESKLKNKVEKLTKNALQQEYKGNKQGVQQSLSEEVMPTRDSGGRELNKDQQEFNRGNKVVDENGDLQVLYHGTNTGEFTIFDLDKANPESDWGAGIYLTNSPGDVESNYTGGGQDWENKVSRLAERIEQETDLSYDEAEKLAREQMEKGAYQIEAYAKMTNPAIVGETYLFEVDDADLDIDENDFDNEDDYYQELEYARDDALNNMIEDALSEVRQKYGDDYDSQISNIIYEMAYEGGVGLQELKDRLGEELIDAADDEGNLISNEIARLIIQSQGYDGIIDNTVSGKWNMNLSPDTTHFIVFKPNQVKSVNNLHPTENVDINLSKSNASWQDFLDKNTLAKGTKTNFENMLPTTEQLQEQKAKETESVARDVEALNLKEKEQAKEQEPVKLIESEDDTLFSLTPEQAKEVESYLNEVVNDNSIAEDVKDDLLSRFNSIDSYKQFEDLKKAVKDYKDLTYGTISQRQKAVQKYIEDRKSAEGTQGQTLKSKEVQEVVKRNADVGKGNTKTLRNIIKQINEDMFNGNLTDSKIDEYVDKFGDELTGVMDDYYEYYKDFKKELRNQKIYVSPEIKRGITDYNDFRKANMGTLNLTTDRNARAVDQVYQEMQERWGELLPDDIKNPIDQLEKLAEVSQGIKEEKGRLSDIMDKKYGRDAWDNMKASITNDIKELRDTPKVETQETEDKQPNEKMLKWMETAQSNSLIREFIEKKDKAYIPDSNKKQLTYANKQIAEMGYENAKNYIDNKIKLNERVNATDMALSQRLIQEAIKLGKFEDAQELIVDTAILSKDYGQVIQATSMISRLTPEGQLMYLNKVVNRMNDKIDKKNLKKAEDKQVPNITLDKELQTDILQASDEVELEQAIDAALQRIADQMEVSLADKVAEWRYFAMLANPRTHVRNFAANVAMRGTYETKNLLQRTLETIASPVLDERTRTFKRASEDVKKFAKQSMQDNAKVLSGTKERGIESRLKEMQKVFKTAPLEKLRRLNTNLLSLEDNIFTNNAYKTNLEEYLTANGIKTQHDIDMNPEIVQKGINFATEEALKTTFHQMSKLASELNRMENINGLSKLVVGGIVPFKKTPINIAKTGAAYSPLGLLETITNETYQLKQGNITANQYIDRLSQGLTGTALMGLGFFLSKAGILKGATDKDEDYEENIGQTKSYSIRLGNKNYDISWLAPSGMPLLMGAELSEATSGKDASIGDLFETLGKTVDPISEMSLLQGVGSSLKAYSNSNSTVDYISTIVGNAMSSYFGQFLPTLGGQVNKIIDDTQRVTTASKNSKWKGGESFARQQLNKIPGASFLLEPKTDVWGNEVKRDSNVAVRAFDALINPGTVTEDRTTPVDEELLSLYSEVGDKDIKPKIPSSSFQKNNYKYEMSAKEYTNFKKDYGQKAYDDIKALIDGAEYKEADSEEKAEMIKDIYTEASNYAREKYGINPNDLVEKYGEREAAKRLLDKDLYEKWWKVGDVGLDNFWNAYNAQKEAQPDRYSNGKAIPLSKDNNRKKAIDGAINQDELNKRQIESLYEVFKLSKKVY